MGDIILNPSQIPVPVWTPILTNTTWQKKKGDITKKIGGKTGIGEAIDAAHAEFTKIKWKELGEKHWKNLDRGVKYTPGKMEAEIFEGSGVERLKTDLERLRDKVEALGKKWKTNKLIPGSATAACHEMRVAAEAMLMAVEKWRKVIQEIYDQNPLVHGMPRNR